MSRDRYLVLVVLTILVSATVLSVLGAELGFFPHAKDALLKFGPAGALAQIIALFAFVTKEVFGKGGNNSSISLLVGPPVEFRDFDITRIQWSESHCKVLVGVEKKEQKVTLVPARAGGSFRIQLPEGFLDKLDSQQPIELVLTDIKGNRWSVRPFYPAENMVPLFMVESRDKIVLDYGENDDN